MATFESIAELSGKTATGIPVPDEVVESLGAGKRVPIVVTINGHSYRSSVAPYRGAYMIAFSAENRIAAGVEPNEPITVTIEVDAEPRVVEVPADLQAAIDTAGVGAAWAKLSYSNQRQHVLAVEGAKAADTRARRVDAVVAALR
jgi:hypothetical protein